MFLGFFSYFQIRNKQLAQLKVGYYNSLSNDLKRVDYSFKEVERNLQFISKNPVLQKLLINKYEDYLKAHNDVYENLDNHFWYIITSSSNYIKQLVVISFNDVLDVTNFVRYDVDLKKQKWFRQVQKDLRSVIHIEKDDLYLAYPIFQTNSFKIIGIMNVLIDLDKICDPFVSEVNDWEILYQDKVLRKQHNNGFKIAIEETSKNTNFKLKYYISKNNLEINSLIMLMVVLVGNGIIIFLFLYYNYEIEKNHLLIMEENKKQESLRLSALKAQISPHFLYNIMSMINWKAKYSGQKEISDICLSLSKFYQTALNKGQEEITLEDEIVNIESYLNLKLKLIEYPFEYVICCDEEFKKYKIINFILQPIVENAIIHGIGSIEKGGLIKIEVFKDGEDLLLVVSDNGKGMDKPYDLFVKENKGYGIRNVHERIILRYGNQYGISLKSDKNGTKVVLKIKIIP